MPDPAWLFGAAAALGLTMAPRFITGFSMVSRSVRAEHRTDGLTLLTTAAGIGISAGTTLAGRLVDAHGPRGSFAVASGCALVAVLTGAVAGRPAGPPEPSGRTEPTGPPRR